MVVGVLVGLIAADQGCDVSGDSSVGIDGKHGRPVVGTGLCLCGSDGLLDVVDTLVDEVELGLVVVCLVLVYSQILYLGACSTQVCSIVGNGGLQGVVLLNGSNGVGLVVGNLCLNGCGA